MFSGSCHMCVMRAIEKSPICNRKSPRFCQKSPKLYEKGPTFYEKCPVDYEKRPVFNRKSPRFCGKSRIFHQKSPVSYEKGSMKRALCNMKRGPYSIERGLDSVIWVRCAQLKELQQRALCCTLSTARTPHDAFHWKEPYIPYCVKRALDSVKRALSCTRAHCGMYAGLFSHNTECRALFSGM